MKFVLLRFQAVFEQDNAVCDCRVHEFVTTMAVDGSGGAMSASDSTKPEVRKTVTVPFSDVADSTPLGEMLDPESTRAPVTQFFEVVQDVLERHGGTVEKFIGDAVMAVFGVPLPCTRTMRCARFGPPSR